MQSYQGDGAALLGLRRHVADDKAVAAAAEAPVGDESAVLPEARAHDGAGGRQHLRHAGPTLGALIPNHYHGALQAQPQRSPVHASNTSAAPYLKPAYYRAMCRARDMSHSGTLPVSLRL